MISSVIETKLTAFDQNQNNVTQISKISSVESCPLLLLGSTIFSTLSKKKSGQTGKMSMMQSVLCEKFVAEGSTQEDNRQLIWFQVVSGQP